MSSGLIGGIGAGVIIIFIFWVIAIILCCFMPREHGHFTWTGILGVLLAIIVTSILISLPRSPKFPQPETEIKVSFDDGYFFSRVCLVTVMGLTFIVGLFLMMSIHWSHQIRAKPYKKSI